MSIINERPSSGLLKFIQDIIDATTILRVEEKMKLKSKISHAKTIHEMVKILDDSKLSSDKKLYEIAKNMCLLLLDDNPNYDKITKIAFKRIFHSDLTTQEKIDEIKKYITMHNIEL